nr:uncharacterized protein LOC109747954 isoform X2 [Aegilops tauschii subsp. strangulata]
MAPLTWSLGAARPCGHPDGIGSGNGGLNVVAEKIGGKVLKATNILAEAFAVAKDLHVDAKQHTLSIFHCSLFLLDGGALGADD